MSNNKTNLDKAFAAAVASTIIVRDWVSPRAAYRDQFVRLVVDAAGGYGVAPATAKRAACDCWVAALHGGLAAIRNRDDTRNMDCVRSAYDGLCAAMFGGVEAEIEAARAGVDAAKREARREMRSIMRD